MGQLHCSRNACQPKVPGGILVYRGNARKCQAVFGCVGMKLPARLGVWRELCKSSIGSNPEAMVGSFKELKDPVRQQTLQNAVPVNNLGRCPRFGSRELKEAVKPCSSPQTSLAIFKQAVEISER